MILHKMKTVSVFDLFNEDEIVKKKVMRHKMRVQNCCYANCIYYKDVLDF